jgi:hypothetical protein
VYEHLQCPKQRPAQLLFPAQARAKLAALCQERLYLATPTLWGVPPPPLRLGMTMLFREGCPHFPEGMRFCTQINIRIFFSIGI